MLKGIVDNEKYHYAGLKTSLYNIVSIFKRVGRTRPKHANIFFMTGYGDPIVLQIQCYVDYDNPSAQVELESDDWTGYFGSSLLALFL